MRKKRITAWTQAKRRLKRNPLITKFLLPEYRNLKYLQRRILFKAKEYIIPHDSPNPDKILYLDPQMIVYHTNFCPDKYHNFEDRVFNMTKYRGGIESGNWDISNNKFKDLEVYNAFKGRIVNDLEWSETSYYQRLLNDIKNGYSRFSCHDESDLIQRFKQMDLLIDNIRETGYKSAQEVLTDGMSQSTGRNHKFVDEITVNIGRDGKLLFQNGRHRLSIALLLGIEKVPVQILVRHKKWISVRNILLKEAENGKGMLYQPALHPDLEDIPAAHVCIDRFEVIKKQIHLSKSSLLDVGANLGYFCHKFEELGFNCIGVENDSVISKSAEVIKQSTGRHFKIVQGDILDQNIAAEIGYNFDVVLFLNILHHFLKEKELFEKMTLWLNRLNSSVIFFEPHLPTEPQMQGAYCNFNNEEFLTYIMNNTKKLESKPLHTTQDGRTIYMLT